MPKLATVSVRLDPKLKRYLEARVKRGTFRSLDAAVEAGVRSLRQDEKHRREAIEWLRREVAIGVAEADSGDLLDGEQVMREIRAKLEAMRKRSR